MKRALLVALPLLLVVVGCPRRVAQDLKPAELKKFTSAVELKQYLADQLQPRYNPWGWLFGCSAPSFNQGLSGDTTPKDYSTTNLQEAGVDESDVIKTDGAYFYILANQKLDVVKATPPDGMMVAGHLDLDLPGSELYLNAGKAIVLAKSSYSYYGYAAASPGGNAAATTEVPWLESQPTFDVYVVDLANPAEPAQLKKYSFQGTLVTSRMIGGKLYLVSHLYPDTGEITAPNGVENTDVEDILPKYRTVQAGQESVQPLVAWGDVYHPVNPDGYSLINVTTIDTANPDAEPVSESIMANYGVIYASTQALYVTSTNYDWYGFEREDTEVHKFDLGGESAAYVASGSVPGWLLNQFSMGEKDGFLRIATTEGHALPPMDLVGAIGSMFIGTLAASENHVVVLEQVEDKLQVAGRIDGIAKGEQLYAARFVGDRGFLVTFKKIDPLFTVDLVDPHNPKLVGELKVPGYSEYIHMMDDNHLLTIGKDAQDEGGFAWYMGLKLAIFDVTDLANPALLHTESIGIRGTDSAALRNHKAFTYYNGMLAFPIDLYEGDTTPPEYGNYTFGGLMVYRVSVGSGFEYLGRIATVNQPEPWAWDSANWTRGVFIGDSVYAACEHDVKSAAVADMSTLQSTVDLP